MKEKKNITKEKNMAKKNMAKKNTTKEEKMEKNIMKKKQFETFRNSQKI